jgi:hypothetical protein
VNSPTMTWYQGRKEYIVECIENGGFETHLTIGKQYIVLDRHVTNSISYIRVQNNQGWDGNYRAHRFLEVK